MTTASNQKLAAAIRECADLFGAEAMDRAPLRVLQRQIQPLLKEKQDRSAQTLAFLLDTWIDDFYFNLAGDVPSENSDAFDELRTSLLRDSVAPVLKELAELLQTSDTPQVLMAYGKLIASYLDALDKAEHLVTPYGPSDI